jgi:hypothetical protein
LSLEVEKPKPQPAAVKGACNELSVEGFAVTSEGGRPIRPPCRMEREQRIEIVLRTVGEPVAQSVLTGEFSLPASDLLSKVGGERGEEPIPRRYGEAQNWTFVTPKHLSARQLAPTRIGWEVLTKKQIPAAWSLGEELTQRDPRGGAVRRSADWA